MRTTKQPITCRQRDFLRAFADKHGNITDAANASGIPRRTVYNWRESNPTFRDACDRIMDELLDFVEGLLFEKMGKGSVRAIIYFLKTRGKDRGYF